MKKVALTAATLAMVLTAGSPVMAQDGDTSFDATNSFNEDNSQTLTQTCEIVLDNLNTGDATAVQYGTSGDATGGDGTSTGDDGTAVGGDGTSGDVAQAIAQDTGIDVNIVQQCIQAGDDAAGAIDADQGNTGVVDEDGDGVDDVTGVQYVESGDDGAAASAGDASAVAGDDAAVSSVDSGSTAAGSASAVNSVLPDTGGASLIALGAGALLVGGGLLARRIVR